MAATFTEGVLSSLAPWAPPGSDFANYTTALASMFEQVYGLVVDQGSPDEPATYQPGWSTLLNPETCPVEFLSYTGLFVGVALPVGISEGAARPLILAEPGFQAGQPAAIVATAKRFLTGTQSVELIKRQNASGPDPYSFLLIVRPEELTMGARWESEFLPWDLAPGEWAGTDQTIALTNAVNQVKPVGVNWTLISTDGHTWSQATKTWSAEMVDWQQADTNSV